MEKVKEKDEIALKCYNDFIYSLCIGLDTIVSLFDPERIILGGGISA